MWVPRTSRGGSQADTSPVPLLGHPRALGLTTIALSSMLLGNRQRPPNCRVFLRFCSQALAMPGRNRYWDEGWG